MIEAFISRQGLSLGSTGQIFYSLFLDTGPALSLGLHSPTTAPNQTHRALFRFVISRPGSVPSSLTHKELRARGGGRVCGCAGVQGVAQNRGARRERVPCWWVGWSGGFVPAPHTAPCCLPYMEGGLEIARELATGSAVLAFACSRLPDAEWAARRAWVATNKKDREPFRARAAAPPPPGQDLAASRNRSRAPAGR